MRLQMDLELLEQRMDLVLHMQAGMDQQLVQTLVLQQLVQPALQHRT